MVRPHRRNRPTATAKSQWLIDHSISNRVLTATVTALELDTQRLPTTEDDTPDFPDDEDASSWEVTDEASTPSLFSAANYDNESGTEEQAPPDYSTTVAEQVDLVRFQQSLPCSLTLSTSILGLMT
jgi:hypothetical protein